MAENDVNVEEKTLNDESRLSLLNDALDQASHKVINKILRYLVVWETFVSLVLMIGLLFVI